MADRETDAHIIAAAMIDPERFAAIFDRHFAAIHRSLARRVGRQLADDLAAETFVEAFRSRGRYDVRYPDARPWLHGIATNVLRHHHRRERRRLIANARTGVDPVLSDQSELADARADADALGPRIALALASLRPRDRDTLLLFAWEQLSYEEVARALGVPVGTVRSRLHRARRMVRELIGDPGQYLTDENVPRAEGGSSGG